MCTRANRGSVPDSLHAVFVSLLAIASALPVLVLALVTAPVRLVKSRPAKHGKPASTNHVEVQVHLTDRKRVDSIERSCRSALRRAARTWAPFPLQLDRVEVLSSAPPLGKADIYERWVTVQPDEKAATGSLVVVSVGTAIEGRDLTPDEIAGALAGQIERLVIEHYHREHSKEHPTAAAAREPEPHPVVLVQGVGNAVEPALEPNPHRDNVIPFKSVQELLADIKKSQPLVTAGSSKNGVHPEPEPA
jgi:hypothetical protein